MGLWGLQAFVLLVIVFLMSSDCSSIEAARGTRKKPGICRRHEDEEYCIDEDQENKYGSVLRTTDTAELDPPSKDDHSEQLGDITATSVESANPNTREIREGSSQEEISAEISQEGHFSNSDENQRYEDDKTDVEIEKPEVKQPAEVERNETSEDEVQGSGLQVPFVSGVKVGHLQKVEILPGVTREMTTLSMRPLVFEIPDFLDPLECDFIAAMAERKGMRENPKWTNNNGVFVEDPERTFRNWDFNGNGFIDTEDIVILPGKMDLAFSENDALEMFRTLRMDKDGNGKIDFEEFKSANLMTVKDYFKERLQNSQQRRNATSQTAWLWHDDDELLRYQDDVLQGFHDRLQVITKIPREIIEESEPIQVSHFEKGSYQYCQQDSEPYFKKVPCCLYGDMKECRLCRSISLVYFLNDVEEGGEIVFPLANSALYEDDIMKNSGNWSGFYNYDKTTGSSNEFRVQLTFKMEGEKKVLLGRGKDEGGEFELRDSLVTDDIISFHKKYDTDGDLSIKYVARLKGGAQMEGRWWVPGHKRMRGHFYMHYQPYEEWTEQSLRRCNTRAYCAKSGLTIKPAKGKAIMWYNHVVSDDGRWVENLDRRAYYGLCDVTSGSRWLAFNWINIIGDGKSTFKAWRRGKSWLGENKREAYPNIYDKMARNESLEILDVIEEEFRKDMEEHAEVPPQEPPERYVLGAVSTLLNALDDEGLRTVSNRVHQKLQLMCIPLIVNRDGQISFVDGSKE